MKTPGYNINTKKKYEYSFDFTNNLVMEKMHGDVFINDVIEMTRSVFSDKNYTRPFNVILDISDSNPMFHVYELRDVVSFLMENKQKIRNTKIAFIVKKPRHVVDSQISQDIAKSKDLHICFQPFSTYEAAYMWLRI